MFESQISEFAKANKISKAKLQTFVYGLVEIMPKSAGGRKSSDASINFREYITSNIDAFKDQELTFKQIAERAGVDPVTASNNIKWLANNKKIHFEVVGRMPTEGKRGKPQSIIKIS